MGGRNYGEILGGEGLEGGGDGGTNNLLNYLLNYHLSYIVATENILIFFFITHVLTLSKKVGSKM